MKTGLLLLSFYSTALTHAQDSISCIRHYNMGGPASSIDSVFHTIPNTLFINFNSSFDDSVIISINDQVMYNKYLKTNHSIDLAGNIAISFNDSRDCKTMTVYFVKTEKYLTEKLDFRFKALDIWTNNQGHWHLDYSNHFPLRE
jgi:hypothetical protein